MARLFAIALLLGSCDLGVVPGPGGVTTDGGATTNGDATFNAMIKPLVTRCIGCHNGVQSPNLTSFALLTAQYKTKPGAANILVTKGNATAGQHQGIAYLSTTDQATVAAWIDSL